MTRAQVSAASAALCRDGQLDRIRSGVYQWSAGQRAVRQNPRARRPDGIPPDPPATRPRRVSAADLFGQIFPSGDQMTGELLTDLEQWARLAGKLAAHGSEAHALSEHPDRPGSQVTSSGPGLPLRCASAARGRARRFTGRGRAGCAGSRSTDRAWPPSR